MILPPSFVFSQSNLSAFAVCRRRFQLRYLSEGIWPAVPVEPLPEQERRMELGRRFHHLVRQHACGVPQPDLDRAACGEDPDLGRWWRAYLAHPVPGLSADLRTEVTLSVPMGAHRLQATYDLIAVTPDRAVIVDWKTERRRPSRGDLLRRLQTRVYRYLLVLAGGSLSGKPFSPGKVTMVYWFAETPERPEVLPYGDGEFAEDGRFLSGLAGQVEGEDRFPLTADDRSCRTCVYRSLCDRGIEAGDGEGEDEVGLGEDAEDGEEDLPI